MFDKKFIRMDEALCRVGEARFGEKWVGELTDEEREVLEGGPLDFPGEYDLAKRTFDRIERQCQRAEEWLYEHCFTKKQRAVWDHGPYKPDRRRGHDFRFDRNKFERLVASQFAMSVAGKRAAADAESPSKSIAGGAVTAIERSKARGDQTRPRQRGTRGRPEAYDWAALKKPLAEYVAARGPFGSQADLINWCIENVMLRPNARQPKGDGPDAKTVKAAIVRHGLDKIGLGDIGAIGKID